MLYRYCECVPEWERISKKENCTKSQEYLFIFLQQIQSNSFHGNNSITWDKQQPVKQYTLYFCLKDEHMERKGEYCMSNNNRLTTDIHVIVVTGNVH